MKIGFVDVDLMTSPYLKRLNVELMKLANYYKKQGHTVEVLHPQSYIFDYDKLCIFCDERKPKEKYRQHPNVDYYGEYYNNKQYVPFSNDRINYEETNYRIYDNLLKYFLLSNIYNEKDILKIKNTKWIRLCPSKAPIDIYEVLTGENIAISDSNMLQRADLREFATKLSIYYYRINFTHLQRITNQEDLDNFMFLKSLNFGGLNAILLFEEVDTFKEFIANNYETLRKIQTHLYFAIGYNKNNLYTEDFYLMDLMNTFKKLSILTKYQIICHGVNLACYSTKPLTEMVYFVMEAWIVSGLYTQRALYPYFTSRHYVYQEEKNFLKSFLNKKPEYAKWFYNIITGEENV